MRKYVQDRITISINTNPKALRTNPTLQIIARQCAFLISAYSGIEMSLRELLIQLINATSDDLDRFINETQSDKLFEKELEDKLKHNNLADYDLFQKAVDDFKTVRQARNIAAHCIWATWEQPSDEIVFVEKNTYQKLVAITTKHNNKGLIEGILDNIINDLVAGTYVANVHDIDKLIDLADNINQDFQNFKKKNYEYIDLFIPSNRKS